MVDLAINSAKHFWRLTTARELHLRHWYPGRTYEIKNQNYTVFRETVSSSVKWHDPTVLIVGFRLKLIGGRSAPHWLFQRLCILTTPFWSGFDGFGTKLWMVDKQTKNYLGIYQWMGFDHARWYVDALTKVLRPLSVKGTVWYQVYPHAELDNFLYDKEVMEGKSDGT